MLERFRGVKMLEVLKAAAAKGVTPKCPPHIAAIHSNMHFSSNMHANSNDAAHAGKQNDEVVFRNMYGHDACGHDDLLSNGLSESANVQAWTGKPLAWICMH